MHGEYHKGHADLFVDWGKRTYVHTAASLARNFNIRNLVLKTAERQQLMHALAARTWSAAAE